MDGTIPKGGTIPWVGPRVGPTADDTGSVKPDEQLRESNVLGNRCEWVSARQAAKPKATIASWLKPHIAEAARKAVPQDTNPVDLLDPCLEDVASRGSFSCVRPRLILLCATMTNSLFAETESRHEGRGVEDVRGREG